MTRIGVVSDTHNYVDPKLAELFAGVDHILHAGDIGQPRVIRELEQLAPVTAVAGNTDDPMFGFRLVELVEVAGKRFCVHHIVNPHAPSDSLQARLERDRPAVIVFGHTHKPFCEWLRGALFFNPGYAGKPRFGLPRSVAVLHCDGETIRAEFLPLD